MHRPTVTFSEEIYAKLKNRMQEKGFKSLSDCIRNLVELMLKIEEAASKSKENNDETDILSEILQLKYLLKNNLIWSLESRLLARLLVETNPAISNENNIDILEQYKNKAQNHVDTLIK
jgi:Arc/MetJ-type ribon-helix-helix transcriptional regulator